MLPRPRRDRLPTLCAMMCQSRAVEMCPVKCATTCQTRCADQSHRSSVPRCPGNSATVSTRRCLSESVKMCQRRCVMMDMAPTLSPTKFYQRPLSQETIRIRKLFSDINSLQDLSTNATTNQILLYLYKN